MVFIFRNIGLCHIFAQAISNILIFYIFFNQLTLIMLFYNSDTVRKRTNSVHMRTIFVDKPRVNFYKTLIFKNHKFRAWYLLKSLNNKIH